MKRIILAAGSRTRVHTKKIFVSKQLFSIYDKPIIYNPLLVLMVLGIKKKINFLTLSFANLITGFKVACQEYIVIVLKWLELHVLLKSIINLKVDNYDYAKNIIS